MNIILHFVFFVVVFMQIVGVCILAGKLAIDFIEWLGEVTGFWDWLNRHDDRRIAEERKLGWRD